jgi:hypothetical protein
MFVPAGAPTAVAFEVVELISCTPLCGSMLVALFRASDEDAACMVAFCPSFVMYEYVLRFDVLVVVPAPVVVEDLTVVSVGVKFPCGVNTPTLPPWVTVPMPFMRSEITWLVGFDPLNASAFVPLAAFIIMLAASCGEIMPFFIWVFIVLTAFWSIMYGWDLPTSIEYGLLAARVAVTAGVLVCVVVGAVDVRDAIVRDDVVAGGVPHAHPG